MVVVVEQLKDSSFKFQEVIASLNYRWFARVAMEVCKVHKVRKWCPGTKVSSRTFAKSKLLTSWDKAGRVSDKNFSVRPDDESPKEFTISKVIRSILGDAYRKLGGSKDVPTLPTLVTPAGRARCQRRRLRPVMRISDQHVADIGSRLVSVTYKSRRGLLPSAELGLETENKLWKSS